MGKLKIEEYFRDRLSHDEYHIDKDQLWESLDLDSKKKRCPLWLLWFFGISIGLALATYGLTFTKGDKELTLANQNNTLPSAKEDFAQQTSFQDSNNENGTVANSNDLNSEIESKTIVSEAKKMHTAERGKVTSNAALVLKASEKKELPLSTIFEEVNNVVNNSKVSNSNARSLVNRKEQSQGESIDKPLARRLENLESLESIQLSLLNRDEYHLVFSLNGSIQPAEPKRNKWFAGAYSSVFFTSRSFDFTERESAYLMTRENTEKSLETHNIGAYLGYQLSDHSYLKLGLEHQVITERFEFETVSDTSYFRDAVEYGATVYRDWVYYNRHKLINIPVTLGFNSSLGKWNIVAEFTPIMTIRRSFSGKFFQDQEGLPTSGDQFSSSFAFAGKVALGLSYQYDKNWSFLLLPSYQRHFSSFTRAEISYDQRYSLIGAQLALQYRF